MAEEKKISLDVEDGIVLADELEEESRSPRRRRRRPKSRR